MTEDTARPWQRERGDRRRVVVVGAGVAGMTAAHELVERGFEVEVVEAAELLQQPAGQDPARPEPRIGGMARTSWMRVPLPPDQAALGFALRPGLPAVSPAGRRVTADLAPPPLVIALADALGGAAAFTGFLDALADGDSLLVIASEELGPDREPLRAVLAGHDVRIVIAQSAAPPAPGAPPPPDRERRDRTMVQITVAGARVPGEHGFRFFPSFYHHLFDTMKRIPIPEAAIGAPSAAAFGDIAMTSDSPRSVFEALLSADVIQLGLDADHRQARSFEIPRRPMRSIEEMRQLFSDTLERAGYRGQDLYRLVTRYVEYLTSAAERRRGYEEISWAEFLGLDEGGYSPVFSAHVRTGAQALVAMSTQTNDARTIGSIAMQLTLDQMRPNPGGYVDATLRGPTSLELFEPWRAYLGTESVQFTRAELVGFTGQGMVVEPVFGTRERRRPELYNPAPIVPADYYVITIPVDRFQALFDANGAPAVTWADPAAAPVLMARSALCDANRLCLELDDLERGYPPPERGETADDIAKYLGFEIGNVASAPDSGALRYMCGIQFYFESDVKMILGHTLCLDSPWGVSHISQSQYWQDRSRGQSGVRGIISAIFTRFTVPAADGRGEHAKTALACTPDELAERVWKQIADAWDTARWGALPSPDYYAIDESLQHDGTTWRNATPYLVNRVGDWPRRGGLRIGDDYRYRIQLGHTVFAGAFMRTSTRLNTMEAANESGRRATNAILAYDGAPQQAVQLWNPEDHELPEAAPLRDLDRRIARRGGHHVLRHTGVEAALRVVPWDLVRLFLPGRGGAEGGKR